MRSDLYQMVLIFLGVVTTALFSVFLYREVYPEYRIYQNDYVALEEFRSTYTGQPPPDFTPGVKQIVIERADKGPPTIDRCTSCHVALQFPDFSPTKIAYDINGNLKLDAQGFPLQVPNENYVWGRLNQKIAELREQKAFIEADKLEALKTAKVGDHVYDVTKVLRAHPLIGRETRPFEYHPVDDYGCVSCHGGNGRGLTTDKAHGPVFDGSYEIEFTGVKPKFLEADPLNDPQFSKVFNSKPGHELLFQTTPILVGSLLQAKCVQCHLSGEDAILDTAQSVQMLAKKAEQKGRAIDTGLMREKNALQTLLLLRQKVMQEGVPKTEEWLKKEAQNYTLPPVEQAQIASQFKFFQGLSQDAVLKTLNAQIVDSLGSEGLARQLESGIDLDKFLQEHVADNDATGTLFVKLAQANLEEAIKQHIQETSKTFTTAASNQKTVAAMQSDVDYLTQGFHQGQELFLSQACYACHRISGFARGGVGPELTREGEGYPWFIKESIVWPQADLKTSTMLNYHLDHDELEALVTYLLAQRGDSKVKSEPQKKMALQEWEQGKKLPWEKPVTPVQMKDLRYAMTVFATEGCAACHRLQGFESNVGLAKNTYQEQEWFSRIIPEEIKGSDLVKAIDANAQEIDKRIVDNVRQNSILEEIDARFPGTIESYYSNFKYASRAKNYELTEKAKKAQSPVEKARVFRELDEWKKRVKRVLLQYIQQYGLGRLVGPRPNWSGVYRSDEWLMEHFRNPSSLVARSIMPVFPFDDTKFYALTNMLNQLGKKNRDAVHEIWKMRGFDPQLAVKIHCAQCHGEFLQGNGPVAEWIYPIPKNLRNAEFMRNLTKERVIQSIVHGVKGTPMPPWGEAATDKPTADGIPVLTKEEAVQIVDWLFATLPGSRVEEVPKWQYTPEETIQELHQEGTYKEFTKDPTSEIFDVTAPPVPGNEKHGYYIKKQFYTPENLYQGKHFFEQNCAVCHGKEADGSGQRAEFLKEAKPRMLTNLNWLETRDDLRLLRSIKYGVPGTAMTPWGDLTSSLQRMQLVMYIRTLSAEPELRNKLFNALYVAFNRADRTIEEARVNEYKGYEKVKEEYKKTHQLREQAAPDKAGEIYTKEMTELARSKKYEEVDQLLNQLKEEVKREREIYQNIGVALISKLSNDEVLDKFIKIINLNDARYTLKEGSLQFNFNLESEKKTRGLSQELIQSIEGQITHLEEDKKRMAGRIPSAALDLEVNRITTEIGGYKKLEQQITTGIEEALRSVQNQSATYQKYLTKRAELNGQV